jgi:hypothetical protein
MTTKWYPLRVAAPPRPLVFGDHAIAERLGKEGLPDWAIGEPCQYTCPRWHAAQFRP